MPRTMPEGAAAQYSMYSRNGDVNLLDILTVSGVAYYWSDFVGAFPAAVGGSSPVYDPYLMSAGPFRMSRSLRVDAGDIVVQNLSGNTIERDVLSAMAAGEFEGALAVYRIWNLALEAAVFEFHGWLTNQTGDETRMQYTLKQLLDPNIVDIPFDSFSEKCSLVYKSQRCGSTSAEVSCPHTTAGCTVRGALHRFTGVSTPPPLTQASPGLYAPKSPLPPLWGNRRPWI